jgi:hypothetical protein
VRAAVTGDPRRSVNVAFARPPSGDDRVGAGSRVPAVTKKKAEEPRWPDGIGAKNAETRGAAHRHASVLSLIGLGLIVGWGLSGFAGNRSQHRAADAPAVALAVDAPSLIRNGEFFESTVAVSAKRRIAKLVIAVSPTLLREITTNSMTPAADKETFEDGLFRFTFGSLESGESFVVKIDSQINHTLFGTNAGSVAVFDGDDRLAEVPLRMRVLP